MTDHVLTLDQLSSGWWAAICSPCGRVSGPVPTAQEAAAAWGDHRADTAVGTVGVDDAVDVLMIRYDRHCPGVTPSTRLRVEREYRKAVEAIAGTQTLRVVLAR